MLYGGGWIAATTLADVEAGGLDVSATHESTPSAHSLGRIDHSLPPGGGRPVALSATVAKRPASSPDWIEAGAWPHHPWCE